MEKIKFTLPTPKVGDHGNPLNERWEKAQILAKQLQLPVGLILKFRKINSQAVEHALDDLEELSHNKDIEIRNKKAYFIFLFKKHR